MDGDLDCKAGVSVLSKLSSIGLATVSSGPDWNSQGVTSSRELAVDGRLEDFFGRGGGL